MSEQRDEFRYERKFLVEQLDVRQIEALIKLHPALFYEPYPPRYVNNLYLDTPDLSNYYDNIGGVEQRRKVRVRWYGDLFARVARPALEFKIKSGLVGSKRIYPFAPFILDDAFDHHYYHDLVRRTELAGQLRPYMQQLSVVLCNRYYRRYFATRDHRFRLTVDVGMSFFRVTKSRNRFRPRYVDRKTVIVELKYRQPLEMIADRVSGFFPFTVAKNSKYVTGIDRVCL